MATCKDCIHYKACKSLLGELNTTSGIGREADEKCPTFADKSRFIELPCKIGDVVYLIRRNYIEMCEVETIHLALRGYIQVRPFVQAWIGNQKTVYRVAMSSWGKTLFATGEEAEAKLKKMKEK